MEYFDNTSWPEADSSAFPALDTAAAKAGEAAFPAKGTWFDPAMDFRDPEGDAVTNAVLMALGAVEQRERKRRALDESNHRVIVRKILANGLRCHFYRQPSVVAYLRKADGYSVRPVWLSGKAMSRAVDSLALAGLLKTVRGEHGHGTASTYGATPALLDLAQRHGITENSLTLDQPLESLVRLRRGNSKTPLVAYEPTADTRQWEALLATCNAFLAQQDIALEITAEEEAEWVRHWNKDRDEDRPSLVRPERFKTGLYRTFSNGSFEQGGRMYGGWWINTPKSLRQKITINGQPTVELDFSGCAIRMLYHERGIDYQGDPYLLDAVAAYELEMGLQPGHFREAIKAITQALINDCDGLHPEEILLPDGLSFRPKFKRAEVRRMIEEKHAPIADAFGTGAGLRLQRQDSDLALEIISTLREQGIVALPIHDSFVSSEASRDNLLGQMTTLYRAKFGFDPVIK